jgi:hypothetical protein
MQPGYLDVGPAVIDPSFEGGNIDVKPCQVRNASWVARYPGCAISRENDRSWDYLLPTPYARRDCRCDRLALQTWQRCCRTDHCRMSVDTGRQPDALGVTDEAHRVDPQAL